MTRKRTKHGDTSRRDGILYRTVEYYTWASMRQRCSNPNATGYERYGGRGIRVCERWEADYAAFLADMGRRPSPAHEIDRIDNDGDYEPGNVRWALPFTQTRNRSSNNVIEAFGTERCVTDWAGDMGASPSTVSSRIERGWEPCDAVSVLPMKKKRRMLTIRGRTMSAKAWAEEAGVHPTVVYHRLDMGWTPEDAVDTPLGGKGLGRPNSVNIEVAGEVLSVQEIARRLGIDQNAVYARLKKGWSNEDTALTPKGMPRGSRK